MGVGEGAVSAEAGRLGTRCCYLPLPLSQYHHGNTGPAGCSSGHIPHHCSHHHYRLLKGGRGRGDSYFYPGSRTLMPTFSHFHQPLCLLSHPLPTELAAKLGVRRLSEGPRGVGEPAKGESLGSAR